MDKNNLTYLSIVIPVYGSEETLAELVRQVSVALENIETIRGNYEIIFVCDNSPDGSWNVIRNLAEANDEVKGLLLRINSGQHNALMAGFAAASGEIIVTMDDDLQHSPMDIPRLIERLEHGYDVVYAGFKKRRHALWKRAGSKLNDLVASLLLKKPKGLYLSPFRAFRRSIAREIIRYQGPYVYVDGLILSTTRSITSIEVDHHDRYAGESGYSLKKSISLWLKMATSFSIFPLRLTSLAGVFCASLGFLLAVALIVQKFTIDVMPIGWSSLIVTILVIGGFQLLALGVIGEYLGRVLLTINSKPQYIISESTENTNN